MMRGSKQVISKTDVHESDAAKISFKYSQNSDRKLSKHLQNLNDEHSRQLKTLEHEFKSLKSTKTIKSFDADRYSENYNEKDVNGQENGELTVAGSHRRTQSQRLPSRGSRDISSREGSRRLSTPSVEEKPLSAPNSPGRLHRNPSDGNVSNRSFKGNAASVGSAVQTQRAINSRKPRSFKELKANPRTTAQLTVSPKSASGKQSPSADEHHLDMSACRYLRGSNASDDEIDLNDVFGK